MLGNTLTIVVSGASKVLTSIGDGGVPYSQEYVLLESLVEYRVRILHNTSKLKNVAVNRHRVEFYREVFATSTTPAIPSRYSVTMEVVKGQTVVDMAAGICAWLTATSNAMLTAVESGQS